MIVKCKKCDFVDDRRLRGHDYHTFEVVWKCSQCGDTKNIKVKE